MRLLAGIVIVGFVLAMTACGDDNGEGNVATTTEAEVPEAPESGSGKADATAETPEELASCLERAGYTPQVIPPPPEGVPGSEFGSIGSVRVEVSPGINGAVAVFFETAKRAEQVSKGALAAQGDTELIGTVYLAANDGKPQEVEAFRTCLKG